MRRKTALIKAPKAEPIVEVLRGALPDHKNKPATERGFDLLAFLLEARFLPAEQRRDLLRACPETVHISRALTAIFLKQGCLHCPPPDASVAIAARMRKRGMSWQDVYALAAPHAKSPAERKQFNLAVRWKLGRLNRPERKPSPANEYGAGGFCRKCYAALSKQIREIIKHSPAVVHSDPVEQTIALTLREDSAAILLSCNEAEHQKIRKIALQRYTELRKGEITITN
jgi:hypothetical protein